ncbi:hypothetical protein AB205_0090960, partial [Aquarana catesbeiana]
GRRLGTSEDSKNTTPKEREITTHLEEDVEGEVQGLGEIMTTTGDVVDVVEEETHFASASAHILIGNMMVCNRELEKIKENINDIEKRQGMPLLKSMWTKCVSLTLSYT